MPTTEPCGLPQDFDPKDPANAPTQPTLPMAGRPGPTYLAYPAGTTPEAARALYFKAVGQEADQVICNSGATLVGPLPQAIIDKRQQTW